MKAILLFVFLCSSLVAQALPLGPQPDPTISTGANGSYLNWQGVAGRTYFMQCSLDLENWDYLQDIEQGQGDPISYMFQSNGSDLYLRLQSVDIQATNPDEADFDLDGYTNAYEVQNGMGPLQANAGGIPGNPVGSTPKPTGTPPVAEAAYQLLIETTEDGNSPVVQTLDFNEDLEVIAINGQPGGNFPVSLAHESTAPNPFKIKVMFTPVGAVGVGEGARLKLLEYQKYNPDPVNGVPQPQVEKLVDWPELIISQHQLNPHFEIIEEISGTTPVRDLLRVEIVPDDNQPGNTGDVIPSNLGKRGEGHYVSPKKSAEIPDMFVVLKTIGISKEKFDLFLEWEGGEEVPNETNKRRVSRNATGKFPVKIKLKDGGKKVDLMNVWIVWAELTRHQVGTIEFRANSL